MGVAQPINVESGRVTIPVELDGKPLTGVIDTTANSTSIKIAVAEQVMGLTMGSADTPVTTPGSYAHSFASLRLGTLGLRNRNIAIVPNTSIQSSRSGSTAGGARFRSLAAQQALEKPEVIIGMDILRQLHIYMAFGEKRLYLTPTSRPAAAAAAPAPAN